MTSPLASLRALGGHMEKDNWAVILTAPWGGEAGPGNRAAQSWFIDVYKHPCFSRQKLRLCDQPEAKASETWGQVASITQI